MSLKDLEDEISRVVDEVESDFQPLIDRANQIDSVIVTVAILRLAYRLIKNGVVRGVTWLRERRHADEDASTIDNTTDDDRSRP